MPRTFFKNGIKASEIRNVDWMKKMTEYLHLHNSHTFLADWDIQPPKQDRGCIFLEVVTQKKLQK